MEPENHSIFNGAGSAEFENGGAKLVHGGGGIVSLRAE